MFLGRFAATLETFSSFSRIETETPHNQLSHENLLTQQRLDLRTQGAYVLDPRLIEMSLGVTLGLRQERNKSSADTRSFKERANGSLLGYDLFTRVLPGKRYSLTLFANRNESSDSRELGGQTDVKTNNWGGTLFGNWLYIPSSLAFRQENEEAESRTGAIVTRVDEQRNVVTYEGRRGGENREIALDYEFTDRSNNLFPDLSFQDHEGTVVTTVDFGAELEGQWITRFSGAARTGFSEEQRMEFEELLSFDHSDRLRTQYRYDLVHTNRPGASNTTQTAAFDLAHRLYSSLSTRLAFDAMMDRARTSDRDRVQSTLGFDYTRRLPRQGRLNLSVGGSIALEDDRFDAVEILILRERHSFATPFATAVTLDRRFVFPSSIEVTKTSGTADPTCGTFSLPLPLVEGQDYLVRAVGNLTEIVPIGCTVGTPGINPGDTITVDYVVRTSPSVGFTTTTRYVDGSLDYGWIRPFFGYERRNQDLRWGRDDGFLDDQSSAKVGVELSYDTERLRMRGRAETERFDSRDQTYDTFRSSALVGFAIRPRLRFDLRANQMTRKFSAPDDRRTESRRLELTLRSTSWRNLVLEGFARYRTLDDTLVPDERTHETGARVRWRFGRLTVRGVARFIDRRRGAADTQDLRASLRVVRRF